MSLYCYNEACTKDFLNLENDIVYAKKAGFDLIEIRFDCLDEYLKNNKLSDLKKLLAENNLKPHALNAVYIYPEFLTDKDEENKSYELKRRLSLVSQCHKEVGIDKCIVVAPLLDDASFCKNYSREDIRQSCIRILSFLSHNYPQIQWIFEPVGLTRSLVRDADFAYEIVKNVDEDNVGIVLDSYNLYLKNRDCKYDFNKISGKKVFAIHLMNGVLVPDSENIIDQRYRRFCDDGNAIDIDTVNKFV